MWRAERLCGNLLTSASTPMCAPTRTPYEMPTKIIAAKKIVVISSAQVKPELKT